jgi:hypothetical protein
VTTDVQEHPKTHPLFLMSVGLELSMAWKKAVGLFALVYIVTGWQKLWVSACFLNNEEFIELFLFLMKNK